MPYMMSSRGEVRFIRQDLVDQMRKAGWSFTIQRPKSSDSASPPARNPGGEAPSSGDPGGEGDTVAFDVGNFVVWRSPDTGEKLFANDFDAFMAQIRASEGYRGPAFSSSMFDESFMSGGGAWIGVIRELNAWAREPKGEQKKEFVFDPGIFGSGLDGRGAQGPTYVKPDRAAVEEGLKPFQIAVTGTLQQGILDESVDTYLATHRKDFDSKGQRHDPLVAAQNVIRNSSAYKDIHELRPESESEMSWVTGQQARLRMVGLNSEQSESLGIQLARIGASEEAGKEAGQTAFFRSTGRVHQDQRAKLKRSASSVLGLL